MNGYTKLQDGRWITANTKLDEEFEPIEFSEDGSIITPEGLRLQIEADKQTQNILDIKAKAKAVIEAEYSDIKQRNILMSGDKEAIDKMNNTIAYVRAYSDNLELSGLSVDDWDL